MKLKLDDLVKFMPKDNTGHYTIAYVTDENPSNIDGLYKFITLESKVPSHIITNLPYSFNILKTSHFELEYLGSKDTHPEYYL